MLQVRLQVLSISLPLLLAACSPRPTPPEAAKELGPIDACALLSKTEMETILGAPVDGMKSSTQGQGEVSASQCYITLPKLSDSAVVVVMRKASSNAARSPRKVWEETFALKEEADEEGEGKEESERFTPEKIEGLGEQAFWAGLQFGGTLHVLQGDTVLRISVGGPGDEAMKRQKLRALAEAILPRL